MSRLPVAFPGVLCSAACLRYSGACGVASRAKSLSTLLCDTIEMVR